MSSPGQSTASGGKKSRKQRDFERSRWLYQKDGRDLGPFKPREIKDLMVKGDVNPDTLIRPVTASHFRPLEEIEEFEEILGQVMKERERLREEAALAQAEERVKGRGKTPLLVGLAAVIVVALVAGWYGYTLYQKGQTTAPSGMTKLLYKDLRLEKTLPKAFTGAKGPIQFASESVDLKKLREEEERKRRKWRASGGKGTPPAVSSAYDLAPNSGGVQELDFSKPEARGSTGRSLGPGDVSTVRQKAVPKLARCAQRVANATSRFPGTTVQFSIRNSGRIGGVKIGANGRRAKGFSSCVRSALAGIRVAPFDGAGRTLRIPLQVSR